METNNINRFFAGFCECIIIIVLMLLQVSPSFSQKGDVEAGQSHLNTPGNPTNEIGLTPAAERSYSIFWLEGPSHVEIEDPSGGSIESFNPSQLSNGTIATLTGYPENGGKSNWVTVVTSDGCSFNSTVSKHEPYSVGGTHLMPVGDASPFTKTKTCIDVESTYVQKTVAGSFHVLTNKSLWFQGDSSTTWVVDTLGFNGGQPSDIDRDTSDNFYVVGDGGFFVQSEPFTSWTKMSASSQFNHIHTVFFDRRDRMFIANDSGNVWSSSDRGKSWSPMAAITGWPLSGFSAHAAAFSDDAFGNIYVLARSTTPGDIHVFRSSGGTGNWTDISGSLLAYLGNSTSVINNLSGDTLLYAATSFGVMQSSNQGGIWAFSPLQVPAENYYGFAKTSFGQLLTSTDLGIYRENSAKQQWDKTYPVNGFQGSMPIVQPVTGGLYTCNKAGVYNSTDGGATWNISDTSGYYQIANSSGAVIFYIDELGNQHASTSTPPRLLFVKKPGQSWQVDTVGLNLGRYTYGYSMVSNGKGKLFVGLNFATGAGVLHRDIAGGAWVADTAGLGSGVPFLGNLIVDKTGTPIGSGGGFVFRKSGGQWVPIPSPSGITSFFSNYSHAPISVDSNGVLFVGYDIYGTYFTTDNGVTWTPTILQSVHFDPLQAPLTTTGLHSYGDTTYATTSLYGIYVLTTTKQADFEPPVLGIDLDSIAVNHERDSSIQLANNGNDSLRVSGVTSSNPAFIANVFDKSAVAPGNSSDLYVQFKPTKTGIDSTLITIASNAEFGMDTILVYGFAFAGSGVNPNTAPNNFSLGQNVPNPTGSKTEITYELPEASDISLSLIDILGNEVQMVETGFKDAGIHRVMLDLSKIPTGVYYYRLHAGSNTLTKALLKTE